MTILEAKKRELKKNLDELRAEDLIPAVVYGPKNTPVHIAVDARGFAKVLKEAGESTTVTLDIEGDKIETLIQEVVSHPVKEKFLHIDFLAIDTNKPIEVSVPLEFIGISNAVKTGLGTLVKVMHEIEIKALPKNLPHLIEVDISKLVTLEDQITIADIKMPEGVSAITPDTEILAIVSAGKEEVEEEVVADLSSIEVEKKGKKDEEEETPAE